MELQSSIEFMLLLAAVAGLSIAVLGMYAHSISSQKAALSAMLAVNSTQANITPPSQTYRGPYIDVPSVSFVNRSNVMLVMLSGDGASLRYIGVKSATSEMTPQYYRNVSINGLEVLEFGFVPMEPGQQEIKLTYYGAQGAEHNITASTYATYALAGQNATAPSPYTASIRALSELLMFNVTDGSPIYTVTEHSHCSYLDWQGQQLSISQQCGNAKWYYWMFSDSCYYSANPVMTSTTCVYLNPAGTSVNGISSYPGKAFNITLTMENQTMSLHSNLTALDVPSTVYLQSGTIAGNAVASGSVSYTGPQPSSQYVVRLRNGNAVLVNQTDYYTYEQAYTSLLSTMAYYNNTGPGGDSSAQQAISSYNIASSDFADALPSGTGDCTLSRENGSIYFVCPPYAPFTFSNITAYIHDAHDQSISAQGSTVYIRRST